MQALFSEEFVRGTLKEIYTIYQVNTNLFQAKSELQILILWKVKNKWEGVSNRDDNMLVENIGHSIDKFLTTGVQIT